MFKVVFIYLKKKWREENKRNITFRFVSNYHGIRLLEEWQNEWPCCIWFVLSQKSFPGGIHDLCRSWGVHEVLEKISLFLQWCVFTEVTCYVFNSSIILDNFIFYRYQVPEIDYACYSRPKILRLFTKSYCKKCHNICYRWRLRCISKVSLKEDLIYTIHKNCGISARRSIITKI